MSANIVEPIFALAEVQPNNAAIMVGQNVITYDALPQVVGMVAYQLRERGVQSGDIVGVSMGHNFWHLMTILALAQMGAISLPLPPALEKDRRLLAARRFDAKKVVSGRKDLALEGFEFIGLERVSLADRAKVLDAITPVDSNTPMRIIISSGTSGNPKGMILTHGIMAVRNQTTEAGAMPASRVIPMDLNFIAGFRPAMSALARGSALVFPPALTAKHVLQTMIDKKVSHVYLSPIQARDVAEQAAADNITCPKLVTLRIGGGPIRANVLQLVKDKLTPNVYISYGSTESGMVTYATPAHLEKHPNTVGTVCKWAEIEVVDSEGHKLPAGTTGTVRIRSEHQVDGYYNDEERTSKHFRGEWFYPGDLGHFDANGLLYIDGREDEQLNLGGMKIDPHDIEEMLCAHPSVLDAGVFIASPEGSETLMAALQVRDAACLDEVYARARIKLGENVPFSLFVAEELPRTLTGKLRRSELADLYLPGFPAEPEDNDLE